MLHNVKANYGEFLELNGEVVNDTFPQALPTPAVFKAYRVSSKIEEYMRHDGEGTTIVPKEEYDKKRAEYKVDAIFDEDSSDPEDLDLAKKRVKWLEFSRGLKPVYKETREPIEAAIVRFSTAPTGSPYITCVPKFIGLDTDFTNGRYFSFVPDPLNMLKDGATRAGLDPSKVEGGSNDGFKYSKYDGYYIFPGDDYMRVMAGRFDYITLDEAKARVGRMEKEVDEAFSSWKVRHNRTAIPAFEIVSEVEHWHQLLSSIKPHNKADITTKQSISNKMREKIREWGMASGGDKKA